MTSKLDKLTLLSGIDIIIPELKISIHQPTLKDIAHIGEKTFYTGVQILLADPEEFIRFDMSEEDKKALLALSNFEFILEMIKQNPSLEMGLVMALALFFPDYQIQITERFLFLTHGQTGAKVTVLMEQFEMIQELVKEITAFKKASGETETFKPLNEQAQKIMDKIKTGRAKVAAQKGDSEDKSSSVSILGRFTSILAVGLGVSINNLMNLTLYQLFDQMERFNLYTNDSIAVKAQLAGAKDVERIDWLKDI